MRRIHIPTTADPTHGLCGTTTPTRQPTPAQLHPWEGYCPSCVARLAEITEALSAQVDHLTRGNVIPFTRKSPA
ncbi:hypothetical protein [Arsenicicoccus dermatophilus]|uniref:hypothetical protein n=1 Tax=Arsenicicoccus dermatophilus TaxID=1076331 RepID=UPI001F4D2ACA|nr:hypothetical protein [Arsenicicoccus dermatophilus]MCH8613457.1 hypothetical protein [Arsenicicoccus dermatophilus]